MTVGISALQRGRRTPRTAPEFRIGPSTPALRCADERAGAVRTAHPVPARAAAPLTPAEQSEPGDEPETPAPAPDTAEPATTTSADSEVEPLLSGLDAEDLRDLGVAEQLIDLALAVIESDELDALVSGAPLLTKDILYGLAAGLSLDEVRKEITAPVDVALAESELQELDAALARTTVTTIDDALKDILEEGDFRAWKVFLHPAQAKLVDRRYSGPFRVSGGPGTGKTIVALHRVKQLAEQLTPGHNKPILLTTFTKNLTTELRARLASLLEPEQLARVDITHIDQLAARVLNENTLSGAGKQRIYDSVALNILRQILLELDEKLGRRIPLRGMGAGDPRPVPRHPQGLLRRPPHRAWPLRQPP
ncbi:UvrD-helicase domain-containing protein [Streptomyces sp. NPDC056628]|uniref:UvrD-helicase domain-containing protein n=1 Tax=Streptomyces sp. NPDC056628 TaxID=3345882 RepID=UPI0036BA8165